MYNRVEWKQDERAITDLKGTRQGLAEREMNMLVSFKMNTCAVFCFVLFFKVFWIYVYICSFDRVFLVLAAKLKYAPNAQGLCFPPPAAVWFLFSRRRGMNLVSSVEDV